MKATVLFLLGVCLLAGCSGYSTAVPAQQGKAFVTVHGMLNSNMYLCDATGGKPVCTEQKEID
jgi:putative hemolysin